MSTKFIAVKIFLAIFPVTHGASAFSQVNHDDSTNYFGYLQMNTSLGNDMRGKRISDFIVKDKKGSFLTPDMLRSKISFVNFWFEACAPCVAEFQALEKFYNNNKSKENFQFVSITFESDSTIEKIRKKNNLTYPVYHLSSDSCRKIIARMGYPATFILDKNLEIVYATSGGPTDPKEADKFLNHFVQGEIEKQFK
jgi:peroxiredoxin